MRSLSQALQHTLPAQMPPAGAMLYGYVDASETGYRRLRAGATTYQLASGIYRGDALAAALTSSGLPTTHAEGRFTVTPASSMALIGPDRLGVLLGLVARADGGVPAASSFTSSRLSPVAIPLAGYHVEAQRIDSDDEQVPDRLERDMGFAWGGARVVTVLLTLHKWALDAWLFGWCQRGRITLEGGNASPFGASQPGGAITGRVMSTASPRWLGDAQLWAEVRVTLAVED
jgi:hypothetical protein